jgi:hypothetical protein
MSGSPHHWLIPERRSLRLNDWSTAIGQYHNVDAVYPPTPREPQCLLAELKLNMRLPAGILLSTDTAKPFPVTYSLLKPHLRSCIHDSPNRSHRRHSRYDNRAPSDNLRHLEDDPSLSKEFSQ